MRQRGIIFAASGPRYVSAAVAAADRSRTCNPVPHVIFCSEEPDSATSAAAIELFSPSPHPHADKIAAMSRSPFAETVYLDVDCAVLGSITELFDVLARYDLAGAHAPGYRGAPDPDVPVCFYEINTGVLAYRNSHKMRHFFRRWHATYLSWLAARRSTAPTGLSWDRISRPSGIAFGTATSLFTCWGRNTTGGRYSRASCVNGQGSSTASARTMTGLLGSLTPTSEHGCSRRCNYPSKAPLRMHPVHEIAARRARPSCSSTRPRHRFLMRFGTNEGRAFPSVSRTAAGVARRAARDPGAAHRRRRPGHRSECPTGYSSAGCSPANALRQSASARCRSRICGIGLPPSPAARCRGLVRLLPPRPPRSSIRRRPTVKSRRRGAPTCGRLISAPWRYYPRRRSGRGVDA